MREFLLISLGAVVGANARYWFSNFFSSLFGPQYPWGTLFVNISGSVLIGFIMALLTERLVTDSSYRLLLVTGFLGSFTTFSSLSYETIVLAQRGEVGAAALNVVVSITIGLLATIAGMMLARLVA